MNKKLITTALIGGTTILTGIGIVLPDLYFGMASTVTGGTFLYSALQVYKDSAKRKIKRVILEELK